MARCECQIFLQLSMREVPMPHLDLAQLTIWTLAGGAALSAFYVIAVFSLQHRWK